MTRFRISAQAEADLAEIWLYVAQDNPQAADRLLATFMEKYRTLAEHPHVGRKRDELGPSLRSFPAGTYVIIYRPLENGIEVVRVLSGYRDIEALFGP